MINRLFFFCKSWTSGSFFFVQKFSVQYNLGFLISDLLLDLIINRLFFINLLVLYLFASFCINFFVQKFSVQYNLGFLISNLLLDLMINRLFFL